MKVAEERGGDTASRDRWQRREKERQHQDEDDGGERERASRRRWLSSEKWKCWEEVTALVELPLSHNCYDRILHGGP